MTNKSKFGFGCMRLPQTDKNDPTSINQELFNQMVISIWKRALTILIPHMHTTTE